MSKFFKKFNGSRLPLKQVLFVFLALMVMGIVSVFLADKIESWHLEATSRQSSYFENLSNIKWFLIIFGVFLFAGLSAVLVHIHREKLKAEKKSQIMLDEAKAAIAEKDKAIEEKNMLSSLGSIMNGIDVMIYVTDPVTSEILFINDSMKKHYKIEGDCVGKQCFHILQKNLFSRCSFCPCIKLDKDPQEPVIWEEHSTLTGRVYRNVDRYIDWPNGRTVHMQHSVDTTELVAAKEFAERSSRYKSSFLANMSHEIRTPMNAILGIAEIRLQDKTLTPENEEAYGKIYESGDLLLNIINDILDLSKIEAGKLELIPVRYDIPSLINDTAQLNRLRYESKPIGFNLVVDENTPHDLIGDELRIKQVLNNILSNAFKYTDEGSVTFSVGCEPRRNKENATIVFRVADTGHGMTEDQINKLFDEYTRFYSDNTRTTIGTGLGMSITKRLVDMMGGEITVASIIGKGSTFTVRIPQELAGETVCGKDLAEKLRDFNYQSDAAARKSGFIREYMPYGSVLVVDDVESNLYVIKGMLAPYGLKVDAVTSGFEAIEKIKDGNVYDIVFMDHMMPKMDGIEAVKIIRGIGYERTIVALTANALVGRAQMFLQNGFDAFISKPIDSRELNHVLNDFIRNKKPHDVVEAARKMQRELEKNSASSAKKEENTVDIKKFFIRDAKNAINVLESVDLNNLDESGFELYVITVHGMKSALFNVGEKELSGVALRLEKAGNERNGVILINETSSFLEELKSIIEKFKPADENIVAEASGSDMALLREKLQIINTSCTAFEKPPAKAALTELRQRPWPSHIIEVLDEISVCLLHSSFKKAAALAEDFIRLNP